jgi:hypothetical protein
MGLPQPLIDALRDIEQAESFFPEETIRRGTEASLRKSLSDLLRHVEELEKNLDKLKELGKSFVQMAEQEISFAGTSPEFTEAIDRFLEVEKEVRGKLPRAMEQGLQADVFSPQISAANKALLVSACERFIKARQGILETLRNLRWSLMALRADAEDPGDAPVFDNPQDLLGYLKTPSK